MTTTMSWQRNHQCHPPLHDPGGHPQLYDPEGDPGDEPGDPLLRRDPTPTTVKPQRRRLRFLRACRHDTPGEARSWRRHLSARGRYMLLLKMMRRMKKTTRVKKRKRKMKKDLPRGGMTTLAPM